MIPDCGYSNGKVGLQHVEMCYNDDDFPVAVEIYFNIPQIQPLNPSLHYIVKVTLIELHLIDFDSILFHYNRTQSMYMHVFSMVWDKYSSVNDIPVHNILSFAP